MANVSVILSNLTATNLSTLVNGGEGLFEVINSVNSGRDIYVKYAMVTLYAIIGCVSFVLNSLIFLIVAVNKKLWTNSYCLLVSLAATDWLIVVIGIPVHIANILADGSIIGEPYCKVYGYFINVPFQSSIYHLAVIAYHRYCLTVRRKCYDRVFGKKKIIVSICMAWFIPMVVCLTPMFGWGKYYYDETRGHCMLDWLYSYSSTIFIEIMVFPLNVLIMAYCYFKIITKARRRLKAHTEDRKKAKRRQLELRSTYMLLVVVMTCVVCFMPYTIIVLYESFSQHSLSRIYGFISMTFAYSNGMFDFIIYSAMNKRFRRCCRQLFSICRKNSRRQNSVIPEEGELRVTVPPSSTGKNMQTVNFTKSTTYSGTTAVSSSMKPSLAELFIVNKVSQKRNNGEANNT